MQEPVLFSSPLIENIAPFQRLDDTDMQAVLTFAGLTDMRV
jgi:ABC-type multidrug transport system fused ATPase/permease subunit